ncbi:hypothetical protein BZA02_10522 [Ruegeria sp. P4]|nr:hypothetical protein BZA02_10522 [Ruegeria sp. P4]
MGLFQSDAKRRVVIAVPRFAHRHAEAVLTQQLLVIVGAVLATAIGVMDARAFPHSLGRKSHFTMRLLDPALLCDLIPECVIAWMFAA